jgi:hypothetical protein
MHACIFKDKVDDVRFVSHRELDLSQKSGMWLADYFSVLQLLFPDTDRLTIQMVQDSESDTQCQNRTISRYVSSSCAICISLNAFRLAGHACAVYSNVLLSVQPGQMCWC